MTAERLREIVADPDLRWADRMQCVARLVRVYRESRGWTRAELADAAAHHSDAIVSEWTVKSVEAGTRATFNPEIVRPLLLALDVPRERYLSAAGLDWR